MTVEDDEVGSDCCIDHQQDIPDVVKSPGTNILVSGPSRVAHGQVSDRFLPVGSAHVIGIVGAEESFIDTDSGNANTVRLGSDGDNKVVNISEFGDELVSEIKRIEPLVEEGPVCVSIDCLDAIVDLVGEEDALRFVHIMVQCVDSHGAVCQFHHTGEAGVVAELVEPLFDATVEIEKECGSYNITLNNVS